MLGIYPAEKDTHLENLVAWRTFQLLEERQKLEGFRHLLGTLLVSRGLEVSELMILYPPSKHAWGAIASSLSTWELTGSLFFAALLKHVKIAFYKKVFLASFANLANE